MGRESPLGLNRGTLLISHMDVPVSPYLGLEQFRCDPEWLFGEGVGSSRAPLVQLEYILRALKHVRKFRSSRLGVVCYADEGRDCEGSAEIITRAAEKADRVLVLNSGNLGDRIVISRRGQRNYRLTVEGKSLKLGQCGRAREVMRVLYKKLDQVSDLSNRKKRLGVAAVDIRTEAFPQRIPHRARVTLQVSYPTQEKMRELERAMKLILKGEGLRWDLALASDRPPMVEQRGNGNMRDELMALAAEWDIPFSTEASLWPSSAGLVPSPVSVLCGLGPVARDLYTAREAVSRMSLVQRTLLMAQYLLVLTEK